MVDFSTEITPTLFGTQLDAIGIAVQNNGGTPSTVQTLNFTGLGSPASVSGSTAQIKVGDPTPEQFGAVGGGGTDDTTAMTAYLNAALANPGVRGRMPPQIYGISAPLPTISVGGVWIEGVVAHIHDAGSPQVSGSVLKYIGASAPSSSVLTVAPVSGGSNQRIADVRLRGIGIDCNSGLIGYGLTAKSIRDSDIDMLVLNAGTRGVNLGVVAALAEDRNIQRCRFRLFLRQSEVAVPGLYLDGDSTANVSMNEFWVDAVHKDAAAVVCANSDNNDWRFARTYMVGGGAATESIQLLGGANSAQLSRDEIFWHLTGNKPIKAYGTDAYTVASYGHRVLFADWDNGTPAPALGTGAWVDCELPQAFTPVITGTAGSGLVTSSVSGSYIRQFGFIDVSVTFVMSAGTGYASLALTMPFAVAGLIGAVSMEKEVASTGKGLDSYIDAASSSLAIQSLDGSTAIPLGTYKVTARYRVR